MMVLVMSCYSQQMHVHIGLHPPRQNLQDTMSMAGSFVRRWFLLTVPEPQNPNSEQQGAAAGQADVELLI